MILRLNSADGIKRIQINPVDSTSLLYETAAKLHQLSAFSLSKDRQGQFPIPNSSSIPIESLQFANGDFVFLHSDNKKQPERVSQNTSFSSDSGLNQFLNAAEIDVVLERKEGLISRERNERLCQHNQMGKCSNCLPLEPYDPAYTAEHGIKHLSYHAYLRKLNLERPTSTASNLSKLTGGSFVGSLEEASFIPKRCLNHPPNGKCTKCQISAVILQTQSFRMVDHVEFQSSSVIDSFIEYWRKTGYQRFGIMYGYYAEYEKVPLGIKAVVCSIFEPVQDCSVDGFELIDEESSGDASYSNALSEVSSSLTLYPVGMIFTDLQDDESGSGKVLCKRNKNSFFVSGFECIFTAGMQAKHPSACKYSATGCFSSKFVSVVVSADENGSIDLFPYQVSNSCVALCKASLIEATTDPSLLRVADANELDYVPEIFYRFKNEYGVEVQKAANPTFPVEYMIVSLTHGFPSQSNPLFSTALQTNFPTPNRNELSDVPSLESLAKYLQGAEYSLELFSNFNLLLFLAKCQLLQQDDLQILYSAVKYKNLQSFETFLSTPSWMSLALLLEDFYVSKQTSNMEIDSEIGGNGANESNGWVCKHCTYFNTGGQNDCEMCALPK